MDEKILLIGGNGFIGKNMIEFLYDKYQFYVVDIKFDDVFFASYPRIQLLKADTSTVQFPHSFLDSDYVINLASIVTNERDLSLFDALIASNVKTLLNLYQQLQGSHKLKLLIQFGSSEEYGLNSSPYTENLREYPVSPYALVKQLTTNTALMLAKNENFPATVVRPGNLFGKYQKSSKFIPYIIESLKKGIDIDVTACEQKRDFIYSKDFVKYIEKILQNHSAFIGEIVNVSSGYSVSLKEIIEFCRKETNSVSKINYGSLPYRKNEAMDLCCSVEKLENLLNEKIKIDIWSGLREYISIKN